MQRAFGDGRRLCVTEFGAYAALWASQRIRAGLDITNHPRQRGHQGFCRRQRFAVIVDTVSIETYLFGIERPDSGERRFKLRLYKGFEAGLLAVQALHVFSQKRVFNGER